MSRSPTGDWPVNDPDHPLVDAWRCPTCDAVVPHPPRPGRRRVYCTNACRQRAYRWRRRNQILTVHTNARPVERAFSRTFKRHALRSERDPASRPVLLPHGEELTVCGVLARPGRFGRAPSYALHTGPWTCQTCVSLTFAETSPPHTFPSPWRPPRVWREQEGTGQPRQAA